MKKKKKKVACLLTSPLVLPTLQTEQHFVWSDGGQ